MSLVDSDHVQPTHRDRHGARYKKVPRYDGQLVPGMVYKYEGAGDEGWECECGRTNWMFTKVCPVCLTKRV